MASTTAIRLQLAAIGIAAVSSAFGIFCVYGAAFPGPCGDNAGPVLGVMEAWLVDAPLGLLALATGLFISRGIARLRMVCIVAAVFTLSLPIIASILLQRWHCA